jgi:hypothetical protein
MRANRRARYKSFGASGRFSAAICFRSFILFLATG